MVLTLESRGKDMWNPLCRADNGRLAVAISVERLKQFSVYEVTPDVAVYPNSNPARPAVPSFFFLVDHGALAACLPCSNVHAVNSPSRQFYNIQLQAVNWQLACPPHSTMHTYS